MRLLTTVLLLSACVPEAHHGPGVVGSPADMQTQPGDYSGYRVVTACEGAHTDVGVIATGTIELATTAAIAAAGQELYAEVADIESIHSWGGYGLACEPGIGTSIWLSDWRDVDGLVARVGDFLRARDYKLQVGITVAGPVVPLADD